MKLFKCSAKTVAVAMLALALAGNVLAPRAAQAQTVTIGVVDEDKLGEGFARYKEAVAKMNTRAQAMEQQLESRKLLNDAEGTQFETLIIKETRTKAEEDNFQALLKTGLDRQAEYIRLNGMATRSDADKARLKQLQDQGAANITKYQSLSDRLFSTLKQQQDTTDKQFIDQARDVIGQVAKEKNFTIVVRSVAVIWNAPSIDITQDVLTRLNK